MYITRSNVGVYITSVIGVARWVRWSEVLVAVLGFLAFVTLDEAGLGVYIALPAGRVVGRIAPRVHVVLYKMRVLVMITSEAREVGQLMTGEAQA